MSKYTTELRYIIESGFDLGMMDYETINEEYRTRINKKIIDHYFFREIGFETVNRFKFELNVKLNEIMPYYNQLLKSDLLEINPLLSFERKHNISKNVDGVSKSENQTSSTIDQSTHSETHNLFKHSDTPMSMISNVIETNDYYASDVNVTDDSNTSTNDSQTTNESTVDNTSNTTETSTITENGHELPLADLILKYRDTFQNVDMMIINELSDLFMGVY